MKKLNLDADTVRVESFEPVAPGFHEGRGTVRGHAVSEGTITCYGPRCPLTYYVTCIPNCNTGNLC
jgi:hypothetical protein